MFTSGATAQVAEDISDTAPIYTATADDADGPNVAFSLLDDSDGLFEVDPDTGEVTLVQGQTLDFETATSHTITVAATDGTGTDTQDVMIGVTDANDVAVITGTEIFGDISVGNTAAAGSLSIHDDDPGQSFFQVDTLEGLYGSLSVQSDGHWAYTLDGQPDFGDAMSGDVVQDVLAVSSLDGSATQNIFISIDTTGLLEA